MSFSSFLFSSKSLTLFFCSSVFLLTADLDSFINPCSVSTSFPKRWFFSPSCFSFISIYFLSFAASFLSSSLVSFSRFHSPIILLIALISRSFSSVIVLLATSMSASALLLLFFSSSNLLSMLWSPYLSSIACCFANSRFKFRVSIACFCMTSCNISSLAFVPFILYCLLLFSSKRFSFSAFTLSQA